MNSKIQSAFSLSFQQLTKLNFIKIFFFHFALTFTTAGIVVYFSSEILFGYVNDFVTSIFNFFNNILNFFSENSKSDTPNEESISKIAKLKPRSLNEMSKIIGAQKTDRFGVAFLDVLADVT